MIEEMNRATVKDLSGELREALQSFAESKGLRISPMRVSFDPQGGEATFKIDLKLPPKPGQAPVSWQQYCWRFDLLTTDFGRTFTSRDGKRTFQITGLRPRAKKQPIICTMNGQEYTLSAAYVRERLGREQASGLATLQRQAKRDRANR